MDLDSHPRGVEPAAWPAVQAHVHAFDHEPNQVPPLFKVGLGPECTGIGCRTMGCLSLGVDQRVEAVDLPLRLDPVDLYRPSASTPRT